MSRCERCSRSVLAVVRSPRSRFLHRLSGMTRGIRCRTAAAWPARAGARGGGARPATRSPARAALGRRLGADGAAGAEIPLEEKQRTARMLMEQGADIYELNTVRKHLSAIKGGQLALGGAGSSAHAGGLGRRRRRSVGHRVGTDGGRRQHVRRRARRAGSAGRAHALSRSRWSTSGRGAAGDVPETPRAATRGCARTRRG